MNSLTTIRSKVLQRIGECSHQWNLLPAFRPTCTSVFVCAYT